MPVVSCGLVYCKPVFCACSAGTLILAPLYKDGNFSRAIAPLLSISPALLLAIRDCSSRFLLLAHHFILSAGFHGAYFGPLELRFCFYFWSLFFCLFVCLFFFFFFFFFGGRCLRFHPLFAVFLEHGRRRKEGKVWHETVKSEGGGGLRKGSLDSFLRY